MATLPSVTLHHEDLERMVPARAEVKGLERFTDDYSTWGYIDNPEVSWTAPNPPTTCADIERFGRLEGYASTYSIQDGQPRSVLFAVHLFRDADGAKGWAQSFLDALAAGARAPGSGYTFELVQPWSRKLGIAIAEHTGPDGIRTWAMFQQGPVIGWIIDLHPKGTSDAINVAGEAARMAVRVDQVRDEAAARAAEGLDVAHLLAAPLPLAAYGERGTGLTWDPWWGACQDNVERGLIAGDAAAAQAKALGRVTGCTGMYSSEAGAGTVVRVFSAVTRYRDAAGASSAVDALIADYKGKGGHTFTVPTYGDRAVGMVTTFSEDRAFTDSRVMFQTGPFTATVAIAQTPGPAEADAIALAAQLEDRLAGLLGQAAPTPPAAAPAATPVP